MMIARRWLVLAAVSRPNIFQNMESMKIIYI